MDPIDQLKQGARATWAAGNYQSLAATIWPVGERLVKHVAVRSGEDVLDVACGTGNAALRAAQAGGSVTGVDLTPEMFDQARQLASEAGVELELVEGDAEALPFDDASFDVVLSTFGVMFAPRHAVAARELVRVLRPGGRLGVCSWTPDGHVGRFFRLLSGYMPAPPEAMQPPPLWGNEAHVRELFAGTGVRVEMEREVVNMGFGSVEAAVHTYTTEFGPLVVMAEMIEQQGRTEELRADLASMFSEFEGEDGQVSWPAEYLVVLGRKDGP